MDLYFVDHVFPHNIFIFMKCNETRGSDIIKQQIFNTILKSKVSKV